MPELAPAAPDLTLYLKRLATVGISLIPLHPRAKNPIDNGWSTAKTLTPDEFLSVWKPPQNCGIRTGANSLLLNGHFVVTLDLDISSAEHEKEAYAKLTELCPWFRDGIEVRSGSALQLSRHFIFSTDRPIASRRLFDSLLKVDLKFPDGTTKTKSAFQIDIFGNGRQHVCAGSVHPDGNTYDIINPQVFEEFLTDVGSKKQAKNYVSFDTLLPLVVPPSKQDAIDNSPIPDKTVAEIQTILEGLPTNHNDSYDQWTEAGFALHHQFSGSETGLELFKWYSAKNPSKYSESGCQKLWSSIKPRKGSATITLRTLVARADKHKIEKVFQEAIGIDDFTGSSVKWINDLDREPKKKGASILHKGLPPVKPTVKNVSSILANDPRFTGLLGWNEMSHTIVLLRSFNPNIADVSPFVCLDTVNGDAWTDSDTLNLLVVFQTWNDATQWHIPKATKSLIDDGVLHSANRNRFHPVKKYLQEQKWDGMSRMDKLFSEYLGIPDNEYTKELSTKFMVGAVQRVMEPGSKFDIVAILEGKQGIRKTTFLSILAVNAKWFNSMTYHTGTAGVKNVENIQGIWINELSETSGMSKANIEELKSFLTNRVDKFRPAYGRHVKEFPRQGVFVGSTNDLNLTDPTGNRRYHPLSVVAVNTEALEGDLSQLWGEAYATYITMREQTPAPAMLPLYIQSIAALEIVETMREDHTLDDEVDVYIVRINEWIRANPNVKIISAPQLWIEILKLDPNTFGKGPGKIIRRAIEAIPGWRHAGRFNTKYGKIRLWKRLDAVLLVGAHYVWEAMDKGAVSGNIDHRM